MPVLINKHNRAIIVKDEDVQERLQHQYCRHVRDEDWAWLESSKAEFSCPWLWEHERGCLGNRTMLVTGGGDSMNAEVDGAYRLVCNPRSYSPPADAMVAIDSVFWTSKMVGRDQICVEEYPHHQDAVFFFGPMGPPPHTKQGKDQFRFGIPVYPIKVDKMRDERQRHKAASGLMGITVRVENAIVQVNICGIAAWLVARYLSTGPIIFTGFPLKGKDIAGGDFDYYRAQIHKWKAVAPFMDRTYIHGECPGPLRDLFPVWGAG